MPKRRLSRAVEIAVWERDNHTCMICNRETRFDDGTVDHKMPSSKGGSDEPDNLQWTCWRCNNLKGKTRTDDEVKILLGLRPRNFNVEWHLSGTVMPVPPYGSGDITNSDSASGLRVSHLDGEFKVKITGTMRGLHPTSRFRVFLLNSYVPQSTLPSRFSNAVPPKSFFTNSDGAYTWELYLRSSDFPNTGVHSLSVWLNELDPNRTILISNDFDVEIV